MINMKIEYSNNKIIIYLFKYDLSYDNVNNLNTEIKNIFIKLIKIYKFDFFGYFKVIIYRNKKYGSILEIEKIYSSDYEKEIIDLKIIVKDDIDIYLCFDEYPYLIDNNYIFVFNNKYYVNIKNIDNIYNYIEFGLPVYNIKNKLKKLIN